MPGVRRDHYDTIAANHPHFRINNHFDLSLEEENRFFIGVAMFVGPLPGGELDQEERYIGSMFESLKIGNLFTSRFQHVDFNDFHSFSL